MIFLTIFQIKNLRCLSVQRPFQTEATRKRLFIVKKSFIMLQIEQQELKNKQEQDKVELDKVENKLQQNNLRIQQLEEENEINLRHHQ